MADKKKEYTPYEEEMRAVLANPKTRRFLFRLISEGCHVFDVGFPTNAAVYSLCAQQDLGKKLMNFAKKIDFDKFNQAEKEYNQMIENSRQNNKQEENSHE
jgi:hypothetical protein